MKFLSVFRPAARAAVVIAIAAATVVPLNTATAAVPPSSAVVAAAAVPTPTTFHSAGNPILSDGSYYSADAATLVVGDKLYVYAGHDEATAQQGGFEMHNYGVFVTSNVESGDWSLYKDDLDPAQAFSWADGNAAYAGQVMAGTDGKYYWYVPVETKDTTQVSRMAIGVAVSDTPLGPWTDAIGKPLLTYADVFGTSTTGLEIIDPTMFRDDDGKVYLYWGSWGVAHMVQLTSAMTATVGPITTLSGLTNFYEGPWIFKRNGLYYMAYDWKLGGTDCTPSTYQACIGYATATSPGGPWTYQGTILGGTSATTVHPSIIAFNGNWYITYQTKDAVGGGHFRRSVAIDQVQWDGNKILPVKQTRADDPAYRLSTNVASGAKATASFTEPALMRTGALNDGRALTAILPPDEWGNYRGSTSSNQSDWTEYQWDAPVTINGAGIQFQQDSNWIRPPASWKMEYLDANGDWQPVVGATYPTTVNTWNTVNFNTVTTTALRATFSGAPEGAYYHSVAVTEWEVYGVTPAAAEAVAVSTKPGVAPALPAAVALNYASGASNWAPVNWKPATADQYADAGTFTVQGRALGYPASLITATVTVDPNAAPPTVTDTTAPSVSIGVSGSAGKSGWYSSAVTARVVANDDISYLSNVSTKTGTGAYTTTSGVRYVDVPVSGQGTTVITGKAADPAGNTSVEVSKTVKIDTTAPTASATVDPTTRAATIAAADALSGLDSVQYRFDSTGSWVTYTAGTSIAAPDELPHILVYRVSDLAGNIVTKTATIPLGSTASLSGNVAQYATASASFTSAWEQVNGLNDGTNGTFEVNASKLNAEWGTWPKVGEQWAQLSWTFDVTVDQIGVWWFSDSADANNAGIIPPSSWKLQYLDADGTTWHDVAPVGGTTFSRTRDTFNQVKFAPIATRGLRIVAQSWGGTTDATGSVGIREWQVIAADQPKDTTAPVTTASLSAADPAELTLSAADEDGGSGVASTEYKIGSGAWTTYTAPVSIARTSAVQAVQYRSTDKAGNVETAKSVSVSAGSTPVSGVVVDAGGVGVGNACVYLYPHGSSSAALYATCSGVDGSWWLGDVVNGSYDVAFFDPTGVRATVWLGAAGAGVVSQSAAVPLVVSGSAVSGANLRYAAATSAPVSGSVQDAGGVVVGNVCVYLYAHGVSSAASYATCSAADGSWWLGGVANGSYDVAFYDPSGVRATVWLGSGGAGVASQSAAVPVSVAGKAVSGVVLKYAVATSAVVSGSVNVAGVGVGNVCVYLYQHGNAASAAYATCSAADGSWWLGGVANGSYDVAFYDASGGHATQWYAGSVTQAGASAVVVSGRAVSGIDAVWS